MPLEEISTICDSSHDSEFKDDPRWPIGSDYSIINYKKVPEYAHPGIHLQYHVAEFFYDLYSKDLLNA